MARPPSIELVAFDGRSTSASAARSALHGSSSSHPKQGGRRWLSAWWGNGKKGRNQKRTYFEKEDLRQQQREGSTTTVPTLDGSDGDEKKKQGEHTENAQLDKRKSRRGFYFQQREESQPGALGRLARDDEVMKFSHSIQFNAVPDWSDHYIAYSNLKKL